MISHVRRGIKFVLKGLGRGFVSLYVFVFPTHIPFFRKCLNGLMTALDEKVKKEKLVINYNQHSISPEELSIELAQFDIISFDIFDTLVFRSFSDPKTVFDVWGEKNNIQYGRKMRADSEKELRDSRQTGEVRINEIYESLAMKSGIDANYGRQLEEELEICFCRQNPYMHAVYTSLLKKGARIIITSDMYLEGHTIKQILDKCGYYGYLDIFVSSEIQKTKQSGELYEYIINKYGNDTSYIHVGDNLTSDIIKAKEHGFNVYHYFNVNDIGKSSRPGGMASLVGGIYRELANSFLYSGNNKKNPYYELGYVYFGLAVYSFCVWLNDISYKENIDLILFAARDMYVIQRVYNALCKRTQNEYVPISRLAAIRADFDKKMEMFFTCFKDACLNNSELNVKAYLSSINFDFIIPILENAGINVNSIMTEEVFDSIRKIIEENKALILKELKNDEDFARQYFGNIYQESNCPQKVLFVDMNGRCTSTIAVQHFLSHCSEDVKVIGAQFYSVSEKGYTEIKMSCGNLHTFMFSFLNNRDLYNKFKKNGAAYTNAVEAIFTQPIGTLLSYCECKGNMTYSKNIDFSRYINDIHQGIFDFASDFKVIADNLGGVYVSGYDAFQPFLQGLEQIIKNYPDLSNDMTLGN